MKKISIIVIALNLVSCSAAKKLMKAQKQDHDQSVDHSESLCLKEKIKSTVYDIGKSGKKENIVLKHFDDCLEDYKVKYNRNDVIRSYKEGLKKYCHKSVWSPIGKGYGNAGKEVASVEFTKIKVCDLQNITSAKQGLKRGHKDGLKRYCNKDIWETKGFDLGIKGLSFNTFDNDYKVCTLNQVSGAKQGFNRGYSKGIKSFCKTINWADEGVNHAYQGKEFKVLFEFAQKCVIHNADRGAVKKARHYYIKGQETYCTEKTAFDFGQKSQMFNLKICPELTHDKLRLQFTLGKKTRPQP